MKSYCKNFTITEQHVTQAYVLWESAAAGKKNRHRVVTEHGSATHLIREIVTEVSVRQLRLRPIHYYWHREPSNGKLRRIGVQSVKQQVLDYAVVLALTPLLEAKLGFYQVASVKGKGQLYAAKAVRRWSQTGGYWIHLDVRQCYPSIRHDVVQGIIAKYVRSPDVRYMIDALLKTYGTGLAIGSYFSLRMAQLVLSFAYHHVESLGKIRRGKHKPLVSHQLHYMDDILLMGADKRDLRAAVVSLETYMHKKLGLSLKPWKICRVGNDEPIDIAGYVIRPGSTTVRDSIFLRARSSYGRFDRHPSSQLARRACSYWGWIKNADTIRYQEANRIPQIQAAAQRVISSAEKSRK